MPMYVLYICNSTIYFSLFVDTDRLTGTAICLIYKENRCTFANIAAAQYVPDKSVLLATLDDLLSSDDQPQIIYIEGFFITASRWPICQAIFERISQTGSPSNITFAINLSSKYIISQNPVEMEWLADCADLMFGNAGEFSQLAKLYRCESVDDLMNVLAQKHGYRKKIIAITNGSKSIDIYCKDEEEDRMVRKTFVVPSISAEELVDTTGAGDAFVAGFCYAFIRDSSIEECAQYGIRVASKKIGKLGGSLELIM